MLPYSGFPSSSSLDCNVCKTDHHHDILVGRLWRTGDGSTFFQYDNHYIRSGLPPLCLNLPLSEKPIPSDGLHPYFCNLISEGWLEEVQGEMLKLGYRVHRDELLARFGMECIGSVKLIPNMPYNSEAEACFNTVAKIMASRMDAMLPGVQPKLLVAMKEDGTYCFPSQGNVSTHIVKLPFEDPKFFAAQYNEWFTTCLIKYLLPDDNICEMHLGKLGKISDHVLFIKRFDRSPSGRPRDFREFNQLLGNDTGDKYSGAYRDMADFIRDNAHPDAILRTDDADVLVLFNRIIASILVGNSDTHLKNFGLLKGEDNIYRLSPNYDLLCCSLYKDSGPTRRGYDTLALRIGRTDGKISIKKLTPKHIIALGEDFGLDGRVILDCVTKIGSRLNSLSPAFLDNVLPDHYIRGMICSVVRKRWNSTFVGVSQLLARREACSRAKVPQVSSIISPPTAAPSSHRLYLPALVV